MKWLTQLDHVACKWRCAFTTAQTGFRTVFCLDACFGFLWYKLLHPKVCFQLSFFTTIQFSRHVWRERLSATMSRALVSRKTMTLVYKHLKMCLMSNEGLLSPRCGSLQSVSGHSLHTDAPACGPDNHDSWFFFLFFFFPRLWKSSPHAWLRQTNYYLTCFWNSPVVIVERELGE